ncbi:hypothetical protein ESCO_006799 [Escovopsis weberi]|uniref:Uncharacterized protein n=1 Tax=Escovopsis weberi TaxID=150374 RepID=A0A0M9VV66_ESCWE|nr:hypothetical protein ESCO_006799 [Escovopsis weberi]
MDDFALSKNNLERLKQLQQASSGIPDSKSLDLAHAAARLSETKTKQNRLDATLLVYATLGRLRSQASNPSDAAIKVNDEDSAASQVPDSLLADQQALGSLVGSLVANGLPILPAEYGVGSAQDTEPDFSECRLLAEISLASLALICCLDDSIDLSNRDLLAIAAYTDASDPWSNDHSARFADILLKQHLPDERRSDVILKALLQDTLRPLFSRPSARLTVSGRPSRFDQPASSPYDRVYHHETPQWKKTGCFVVSTFRYAIKSDTGLIARHWPLYLPAIVALAEDEATIFRVHGLQIMQLFLQACPSEIIRSIGIGNVFRDTVFPTLLFLPTLTPEEESVRLLRPAYSVLIRLAELEPPFPNQQKQQLLDKLIRDGVAAGYTHASQHIRIVQVLMESLEAIVKCMGVYAVKHLQIISSILTDPFAVLHPPTVITAAKALNTIIINCWPRSSEISRTLHSMWKQQGHNAPRRLHDIIQNEPHLRELFGES